MAVFPPHVKSLFPYLGVLKVAWFLGLILLVVWGYEESFLVLNQYHHPLLDKVMPHFTHMGEGVLLSALVGLLLTKKDPPLIITLIAGLLMILIFIGVSKQWIFSDWMRPMAVFHDQGIAIHHVALRNWLHHSFPSGHSASAALVLGVIAFVASQRKPLYGGLIAVPAILAIYSRLYIGIHFLGDILAGSAIGAGILLFSIWRLYQPMDFWYQKQPERVRQRLVKGLYALSFMALAFSIYHLITTYYLYA